MEMLLFGRTSASLVYTTMENAEKTAPKYVG